MGHQNDGPPPVVIMIIKSFNFVDKVLDSTVKVLVSGLLTWLASLYSHIAALILLAIVGIFLAAYWLFRLTGIRSEEGNFLGGHRFMASSKRVDMIATNFQGFDSFENNVRQAVLNNQAKVRVLLLHPDSSSFAERMVQYGEMQTPTEFGEHFLKTLAILERLDREITAAKNDGLPAGTLKWKFYIKTPTKGVILTDKKIRFWPYFATKHQFGGPTLTLSPKHPLGRLLQADFDDLWKDETAAFPPIPKSVAQPLVYLVRDRLLRGDHDIQKCLAHLSTRGTGGQSREFVSPADWPWPEASAYVQSPSVLPSPSLFARTLAESLPVTQESDVLDVGCGSGVVGIYALQEKGARSVTFNDIQAAAVAEAMANVGRQVAIGSFKAQQASFFLGSLDSLSAELVAKHSLVAFNPPQFPTDYGARDELERIKKQGHETLYRLAGPDGLGVVRQFLRWFAALPAERPNAFLVLSSFLGRTLIDETIKEHELSYEVLASTPAPLRQSLIEAAMRMSAGEQRDRALSRNGDSWTKELWVYRIK